MSRAEDIMRSANRNALIQRDDVGNMVASEDHTDPDGRLYRLSYTATADGRRALAYCTYNPWGSGQHDLNAGMQYHVGHVWGGSGSDRGFICVGDNATKILAESPYDLEFVIKRARYWTVGFSVLKETGAFPQPV